MESKNNVNLLDYKEKDDLKFQTKSGILSIIEIMDSMVMKDER